MTRKQRLAASHAMKRRGRGKRMKLGDTRVSRRDRKYTEKRKVALED